MSMAEKHNKSTGRNYEKEYSRYQGRPEQIKRRSQRNKARRKLMASGRARKGDDKDVHHKHGLSNASSNLGVVSKSKNRGFKRSSKGKNLGLRK